MKNKSFDYMNIQKQENQEYCNFLLEFNTIKTIILKSIQCYSYKCFQIYAYNPQIQYKKMEEQVEYTVTLVRMSLPVIIDVQKIVLSLTTASLSTFINNSRKVKDHKVNFYRQNISIPSIQNGIIFSIYSVDNFHQLNLLNQISITPEQLFSINKRAALFHSKKDDFELVWQCSVFNKISICQNEETDKSYTEFQQLISRNEKFSLGNRNFQQRENALINPFIKQNSKKFKRSTSTDSSFSANTAKNRCFLQIYSEQKKSNVNLLINSKKSLISKPNQHSVLKPGYLRSHMFQFLKNGIHGLFSFNS